MQFANGKYIFFLDSDDYLELDILGKMVQAINKTKSDVIISRINVFADEKDDYILSRIKGLNNYLSFKAIENYQVNFENFEESIECIPCVCYGKLYSRNFIKKNRLEFIHNNVILEDDGFNLKLLSCYPNITLIDDIGVNYRIRKGSTTFAIESKKNQQKKLENMRKTLEDVFSFINKREDANGDKLINIIKQSNTYSKYFTHKNTKTLPVYKQHWWKYNKEICVFGIPLFMQKINQKRQIVYKIFGITVWHGKYINL